MSNHINSAFRVLDILEKAQKKGGKEKVFEVWASIFEIEGSDQNKKNFEISECLNQLHGEIEIVRRQMSNTDFESKLYEPWLNKINTILAVHALMTEWQGMKNTISGEVLMCLGFCKQILPDEESLIEKKDVEELQEILASLEAALADSTLPEFTQNLIRNHVKSIRAALRSYNIVGAKALQAAMNSAVGEVVANDVAFSKAKESKEVTKVGELLLKLHGLTEKIVKSEKVVSAGVKLEQHGAKALEIIEKLID